MDEVIGNSLLKRRFVMLLLSAFSLVGVILAVVGIAAIVAYSLSLRLREVSIRVAVGASPQEVILLMARQGVAPAFTGLLLGTPAALVFTQFLAHLLYEVSPHDPAVFALVIFILGSVSLLVACVSASRASRLDTSNLLKWDYSTEGAGFSTRSSKRHTEQSAPRASGCSRNTLPSTSIGKKNAYRG
jgi:putative ABC transport system permease protein